MTSATQNTGHGHVRPRPDGVKARCGGPGICAECSRDRAELRDDPLLSAAHGSGAAATPPQEPSSPSMRERLARAMAGEQADMLVLPGRVPYQTAMGPVYKVADGETPRPLWELFLRPVDALLDELAKPDDAMVEAALAAGDGCVCDTKESAADLFRNRLWPAAVGAIKAWA